VVSAFSRKPSGPPRGDAAAEQPPVIVEPAQALAIARLYELLRQGRLTEEALSPGPPHDTAELSVEPLRIPEITVPDLEAAGRAPGSALERD